MSITAPPQDGDAIADTLRRIVAPIEARHAELGDRPEGLWWPNGPDLALRYAMLLGPLLPPAGAPPLKLLDVGCGSGFLPDWLAANGLADRVAYTGLEASAPILARARARHPKLRLLHGQVPGGAVPPAGDGGPHDVVLACGLLTARFAATEAAMLAYAEAMLAALWPAASRCLAFNTMAKHVEWEREDLFHWPVDALLGFCRARLSRHVVLRADGGLWENMVQVHRAPQRPASAVPACWTQPG